MLAVKSNQVSTNTNTDRFHCPARSIGHQIQTPSRPRPRPSLLSPVRARSSLCPAMAGGGSSSSYEEALNCLSSLKTQRNPADSNNTGDNSDLMFDYLKILDLEDPISRFKVIHVAGTKGKGSTCTFIESILRHCGFRTALYTSPHLIDLRERFQLDGVEISEEKFLTSFWRCWDRLKEKCDAVVPMPSLFRLLTLLAFKIFAEEQVDVVILEVGIGGKFDATNVVRAPIVCGISSLGYDHMEILGNTLGEISGEKAGIFKQGVPAFTVPQPEEAMSVLEAKASELGIPLQVAMPLDIGSLNGQRLGLDGEHQYINAGLAVALSRTWLEKTGHTEGMYINHTSILPEQFIRGFTMAHLQGRAQIIPDPYVNIPNQNLSHGSLVFYLDGAHTPESLETCVKWFSHVIRQDTQESENLAEQHHDCQNARQILLFNCMSLRDPHLLLRRLKNACAHNGVRFYKALFVPNQYHKVSFHAATPTTDPQQIDLSWQLTLQRVWENLIHGKNDLSNTMAYESSSVFPSIPLAIEWLRESIEQNRSIQFQVLVTGSMQLVGDVLRLIKK